MLESQLSHVKNVTVAGIVGMFLFGISMSKWLSKRPDPFPKVPGWWFFGVYFQMGFKYSRLYTKLNEFSKEFGGKGVYEMEVLGERSVVAVHGRPPRRSLSKGNDEGP